MRSKQAARDKGPCNSHRTGGGSQLLRTADLRKYADFAYGLPDVSGYTPAGSEVIEPIGLQL